MGMAGRLRTDFFYGTNTGSFDKFEYDVEQAIKHDLAQLYGDRRAARKNAPGYCTDEQLAARIAYYGNKCAYCPNGKYEHLDHVIPLARGGSQWPSNLRPACAQCNLSKGAKDLMTWLREQGRL